MTIQDAQEEQLITLYRQLTTTQRDLIFAYLKTLTEGRTTLSGTEFIEQAQAVDIDDDDLRLMAQAIADLQSQIEDFPEVDFDE